MNWKRILPLLLLFIGTTLQAALPDKDHPQGISVQMAQDLANLLRGAYDPTSGQNANEDAFDMSSGDYTTLDGLIGQDHTSMMGHSQRMVVNSVFAMGQSMDNISGWQSIKGAFTGSVPITDDSEPPKVGILSGWIFVPSVLRVFITMDMYLGQFFSGGIYFAVLCLLIIMMGVAILMQMAEGKLDLISYFGKAVFAILCLSQANAICNYFLAAMIGVAALINVCLINKVMSEKGMDEWYLRMFGPQITKVCYSIIAGTDNADIAKAFDEPRDMSHIGRYIMYEHGRECAKTLARKLGGAEGYNSSGTTGKTPLKELVGIYSMTVVYNVGLQNLQARKGMGYAGADDDIANFKWAVARLASGNDGLTKEDTGGIEDACSKLSLGASQTWSYLANAADPNLKKFASFYMEPDSISFTQLESINNGYGWLHSKIHAAIAWLEEKASSAISFASWLPAKVTTFLTQGMLQFFMICGVFFWMMASIALCKMGIALVVLTSPLIMTESTSKYFWSTFKAMCYPAIYPPMLIIIMQLTSAMASWIGSLAASPALQGLTLGTAVVWNVIPLLFGLASIIFLPKLVNKMLSGGNLAMAQLGGAIKGAILVAAAAMGAGVALKAASAAKGSKALASTAAGTGGGSGVASGGASGGVGGGSILQRATNAIGRGIGAAGRGFGSIMKTRVPGTKTSVGKMAYRSLVGGVPGMMWGAARDMGKAAHSS